MRLLFHPKNYSPLYQHVRHHEENLSVTIRRTISERIIWWSDGIPLLVLTKLTYRLDYSFILWNRFPTFELSCSLSSHSDESKNNTKCCYKSIHGISYRTIISYILQGRSRVPINRIATSFSQTIGPNPTFMTLAFLFLLITNTSLCTLNIQYRSTINKFIENLFSLRKRNLPRMYPKHSTIVAYLNCIFLHRLLFFPEAPPVIIIKK